MQRFLRDIAFTLATNGFWLKAVYIKSADNRIPDLWSRYYQDTSARLAFEGYAHINKMEEIPVYDHVFLWCANWWILSTVARHQVLDQWYWM